MNRGNISNRPLPADRNEKTAKHLPGSSLSLFVARIAAHHVHHPAAADDFTVVAYPFYTRAYFHKYWKAAPLEDTKHLSIKQLVQFLQVGYGDFFYGICDFT
jgi:hypothetical protein